MARKVVARLVAEHGVTHHADVIAVAECCWEHPSFDARRAATEVLTLRHSALVPADLAVLEVMLRDAETWAIVDGLATKVRRLDRHPVPRRDGPGPRPLGRRSGLVLDPSIGDARPARRTAGGWW